MGGIKLLSNGTINGDLVLVQAESISIRGKNWWGFKL